MRLALAWTFAAAAALTASVQSAPLTRYVVTGVTITDLGTLGGLESVARDINDGGTIVGWSRTASGLSHAFQYRGGVLTDLGAAFGSNESQASGVNARNEVVGSWWRPGASFESRAVYWNAVSFFLPDVIHSGVAKVCEYGSSGIAINDTGTIAGAIGLVRVLDPLDPSGCLLGFNAARWSPAHVPSLLFGGPHPNIAHNINSAGTIVGHTKTSSHEAFVWKAGVVTDVPVPLAPAGMFYGGGSAHGINSHGHVVGYFDRIDRTGGTTASNRRAFRWDGVSTKSIDLGTLATGTASVAREINDQAFIAGYGDKITLSPLPGPSSFVGNAAFLWHADFGMYALPRLPASGPSGECEAYALNNRKSQGGSIQVVGYCTSGGRRHAVRWDVTATLLAPICPTPTC